ncbi:MAG: DUF5110 domain-containing protein [Prevotella sp.]|nr:DUF5110 domain-containing protein [Prevotella sp.]
MNRKLLIAFLLCVTIVATAQNPMQVQVGQHQVKVEFYTPSIVHVVKAPVGHQYAKESLVVIAKPDEVPVVQKGNAVSSDALTVKVDAKSGNLTFSDSKGRVMLREKGANFEPVTKNPQAGAYKVTQTFVLDKDEAIYGLGTVQNGKMNRRGTHILMEQSNLEDFQNVIQSVKGWGLFWDNYAPTQFDDDAQGMSLSSQVGDCVDYYFMLGGSADGVIAQMRHLSGDVPMFPLWTYGYWQSKERYKTSKETLGIVEEYRRLGVPLDGIIQDWQYWGNNYLWNAMDFLSEDFVDGKQLIDKSHALNAHFMISIWASFGPMTKAYKQLDEKGLLFDFETWPQSGLSHIWPPRRDYPSGVRVYDAFSQEARDIYWQNLKRLYDYGVDAWWMDSTDPDFFNPTEADYEHKAGEGGTWRSLRNAFPLETVKGVYGSQRKVGSDKRVFIMTRSAFAGQQHYGSNMWSGDVASSWDMLRKQVPVGLSFSLTGNPNFNTDIGGFFCGAYNTKGSGSAPRNPQFQELYVRWMQYALFCPVFRSHGADAPREIWQFGKQGEPVYNAIEQAIRLRYRLIPYLYSTAWQVTSNNESYLRPLFSDFAQDRNVWDMTDEFMFGRAILAAPIVEAQYTEEQIIKEDAMTGWDKKEAQTDGKDATADFTASKTTTKYLPKGTDWYDFWTAKRYKGGQTVTLQTAFNRVPMFVRAGSILPLGPEMEYVGQKAWDNLEVRIYPGADGSFTLYEDEGDNYNYEKGVYATIPFHWDNARRTLTIGTRQGTYPGMLTERKFTIVLPDGTLQTVDYNGSELKVNL